MKTKMKKIKDQTDRRFISFVNLIIKLEKLIQSNNSKRYEFTYEYLLEGLIKRHICSPGLTPHGQKQARKWIKKLAREF